MGYDSQRKGEASRQRAIRYHRIGSSLRSPAALANVTQLIQISGQLWPQPPATEMGASADSGDSGGEEDIEKQLAKELSDMNQAKPKGSQERRIGLS